MTNRSLSLAAQEPANLGANAAPGENMRGSAADLAAQLVLITDLFVNKSIPSVTTPNGCTDCSCRSTRETERAVCNYGGVDFHGSL